MNMGGFLNPQWLIQVGWQHVSLDAVIPEVPAFIVRAGPDVLESLLNFFAGIWPAGRQPSADNLSDFSAAHRNHLLSLLMVKS